MPGHVVLRGEKVSLWTITKEDLREIWKNFGDFELRRFTGNRWKPVYYEDEEKFYQRILENKDKEVVFLIVENKEGNVVGMIRVKNIDFYSRHAEISYYIWKEYQNKGYATEAVKLILKYCFEYLNLNNVYAHVFEPNEASQRVLEKNGFKLVGKHRKFAYIPEYGYADMLIYDILKEEWKNKRSDHNKKDKIV